MFTLANAVRSHLMPAPIHSNLRVILIGYFCVEILHTIVFTIDQSISIPILLLVYSHYDANFENSRALCSLSTPDGAASKVNVLFVLGITINMICLIILYIIKAINKNREQNPNFHLSSRYQVTENIGTTQFVSSVSLLHIVFSIIYSSSMLLLKSFMPSDIQYKSSKFITMLFYLNPLFIFILAPLTVWHLKRWKDKRQNRMRSLVKIKVAFWKNSFSFIFLL
ncbi:hypothetical protein WR25_24398 [Diploscapter pachys]|uniref:G-protein coupled receptors family 1 profile domain-containing protein n=1 Tax=Diploscapter pachys TaxID=2018661 RepID=A0A2A2LT79_9BILA|nr:hypothetical protein WR25_24398 [Diploscapter pachys]